VPIFEYTCHECGREVELLIRGSEQPHCPHCGGERLEKLLSVPAAHTSRSMQLPVCPPSAGPTCGLPRCGMGGCGLE
jgi:putative FmdB family regulatory protein